MTAPTMTAPWSADSALEDLERGAKLLFLPTSRRLEEVVSEKKSGRWQVWYGGAGASYARREDGVVMRSLRRLGDCLNVNDSRSHEEAAAIWTGYLRAFGLDPSSGLVGLVKALAPQLKHWRIDTGAGEIWRERLCLAGRAEVLRWSVESPMVAYDMSSAYPWSYGLTLPGELTSAASKELPCHDCCAADVEVEVPPMRLPPVPCKGGKAWAWPTGRWRCWLAGPEAHLADRIGIVRKVHRVWVWKQCSPLTDYSQELYSIRKSAPDKGISAVVKLLLNSTFGLLASQSKGRVVHVRPAIVPKGSKPLAPDMWEETPTSRPAIYHPLAAGILTSRVREKLYLAARQCEDPTYVGVDAIHCQLGDSGAPALGEGLGEWRGEGPWMAGATYLAPGRYILKGAEEKIRHCGVPFPEVVRDLAVHGKATYWVDGDPMTGRPGQMQAATWEAADNAWIGSRLYQGDRTVAPTVERWKAATKPHEAPPDLSDLGDVDL